MNLIKCLLLWTLLCAVGAAPAHHEEHTGGNWFMISDDNGTLHRVDISAPPQPFKVADTDVSFLLYTRQATEAVRLQIGSSSLGTFNPSDETIFIIHGWTSNPSRIRYLTEAYLQTGVSRNILEVDWSGPAGPPCSPTPALCYPTAVRNARDVAAIVARFVDFLVAQGLKLDKVNIVGFSLGAQVAGMAGYRVKSGTVARVTGLDPAGPLYYTASVGNKLGNGSAAFVQVIHTNGGLQGYQFPMGHADFYPNGGINQEGCPTNDFGSCDHHRAPAFYAESITSNKPFTAVRCANWLTYQQGGCSNNPTALMGAYTPNSARGDFWLKTNAQSPFAQG